MIFHIAERPLEAVQLRELRQWLGTSEARLFIRALEETSAALMAKRANLEMELKDVPANAVEMEDFLAKAKLFRAMLSLISEIRTGKNPLSLVDIKPLPVVTTDKLE